jgi:signal transduction histidine kinase
MACRFFSRSLRRRCAPERRRHLARTMRSAPPPRATARTCWPRASTWRRSCTITATSARRSRRSPPSQNAPITVEELHTLNRCLDTAIADAVTEHTRLTTLRRSEEEVERLGQAAHELRDLLNGALLAFHTLKRGAVAISGNTGAVLGRSLTGLRDIIDRSLSEVRLAAGKQRRERLSVTALVDELAATGVLHSEYRGVHFTVEPVDPGLAVDGDAQLLTSAVMNLLHNAFKNTPAGGAVILRVHARGDRLLVEIQDQCGGIPESKVDLFQAFGDRRGTDCSGLGLGLSIARQAVRSHGGDIHTRNRPGQGCIFTIDVPLATEEVKVAQSTCRTG